MLGETAAACWSASRRRTPVSSCLGRNTIRLSTIGPYLTEILRSIGDRIGDRDRVGAERFRGVHRDRGLQAAQRLSHVPPAGTSSQAATMDRTGKSRRTGKVTDDGKLPRTLVIHESAGQGPPGPGRFCRHSLRVGSLRKIASAQESGAAVGSSPSGPTAATRLLQHDYCNTRTFPRKSR